MDADHAYDMAPAAWGLDAAQAAELVGRVRRIQRDRQPRRLCYETCEPKIAPPGGNGSCGWCGGRSYDERISCRGRLI